MRTIDFEYNRLREGVALNLGSIERAREKIERAGLKIPSHLEDKINLAKSQRTEAAKKFEEARKKFSDRGKLEAFNKMQEAANSAHTVSSEMYELYFEDFCQKVREARNLYRGYEYLAAKHITNYREHTRNFLVIKKRRESGKKLSWVQVSSDCDCLQKFLKDFELGKEELFSEIKEKKEADKKFWIGIIVTLILGIIGIVLMVKGCGDSSQQVTQPEPSDSEAGLQRA